MDTSTCSLDGSTKKVPLEDLSREELIKKCRNYLALAQRAKQARDSLADENAKLKSSASDEIIQLLTQQKVDLMTNLEEQKLQIRSYSENISSLKSKSEDLEVKCNELDTENLSYRRQVSRLTEENEQLLAHLGGLEQQISEMNKIGLEQQQALLILEENSSKISNYEEKTQELQEMLARSLEELKKFKEVNAEQGREIKVKESEINKKDFEINEKQCVINEKQSEINEKQSEIILLNEQLQEYLIKVSDIEVLKKEIINKDLEIAKQASKADDLNTELHKNKALVEKLENDTKNLSNKLKDNQIVCSGLNADMENANEKLKEKVKSYHKKIVKLAGDVRKIRESKDLCLEIFKNYGQQVNEWKGQLIEICNKIKEESLNADKEKSSLKQEICTLTEKLKSITNNHSNTTELEQKIEKLNEEKSNLQSLLKDFEENSKILNKITSDDENLKDEMKILKDIHESEKLEWSKARNDLEQKIDEDDKLIHELKRVITKLEREIEHLKTTESKLAEQSGETILRLSKENKELLEKIDELEASIDPNVDLSSLKQENAEMLNEMNEMNQVLKERGETISKQQAHCDDLMKKIGCYEAQLADNQETIKRLQEELERDCDAMSSSTISRGDEVNRLKELDGSWEERYAKLRSFALKLKAKAKTLQEELQKERDERQKEREKHQGQEGLQKELGGLQKESERQKDPEKLQKDQEKPQKDQEKLQEDPEKLQRIAMKLQKTQNELQKTENELQSSKNELQSHKNELQSSKKELQKLEIELQAKEREFQITKSDLEVSMNELQKVEKELSVLRSEHQTAQKELQKGQQEKEKLTLTIKNMQLQIDSLQNQIETFTTDKNKSNYLIKENASLQQKLNEREENLATLKSQIENLTAEKSKIEEWKKQIGLKVQSLRKELEANMVLRKDFEARAQKSQADYETKCNELAEEREKHQSTRNLLQESNQECKKQSVMNLEMQDYERSIKELSSKLERKNEQITKLKNQIDSQKSTVNAVKEQNRLVEEKSAEQDNELAAYRIEVKALKKIISDLETQCSDKDAKIDVVNSTLESIRCENEELSTQLSKIISEHQKINASLKEEKDHFRSENVILEQRVSELRDKLKLQNDELQKVQSEYQGYKVRAQSVLRQNQSRDVGVEEKLTEEAASLHAQIKILKGEIADLKANITKLEDLNKKLNDEKQYFERIRVKLENDLENSAKEVERLNARYQQSLADHNETVRSLKLHSETLSQCYRQQLSEQEVRHNREIIELQGKVDKSQSYHHQPPDIPSLVIPSMFREEGEGSESVDSINGNNTSLIHPLEKLLGADQEQEVASIKKQLAENEMRVGHLTALLADTEQDLAKHVQMNKVLKEEIRRQQRSVERERHAENLEYMKNVVFKFITLHSGDERLRLVPVLNTILKLSPEETGTLNSVAKGDKSWSNYIPIWSNSNSGNSPSSGKL